MKEQLSDKDYNCGTATVETEHYKVKAVVTKKVKWDQDGLREAYAQISASGENPDEYINTEYDVSEAKFKAWPTKIQNFFVSSRTVEPSKVKYSFEEHE